MHPGFSNPLVQEENEAVQKNTVFVHLDSSASQQEREKQRKAFNKARRRALRRRAKQIQEGEEQLIQQNATSINFYGKMLCLTGFMMGTVAGWIAMFFLFFIPKEEALRTISFSPSEKALLEKEIANSLKDMWESFVEQKGDHSVLEACFGEHVEESNSNPFSLFLNQVVTFFPKFCSK